ncbi:diguanylate cyclase domain-containing protein [Rubrivivax rivuli]|uniref:diguanylate cyclase n=1 Tax=Rubrivivax rivuli TaxID=1862385 RepID=A0A437RGQ4_9BURK|nr:diguanylate cyclase [Rubrivivax rivuli]RVU45957.1 diguanylate cyclase [Rubrivivax rivuli]
MNSAEPGVASLLSQSAVQTAAAADERPRLLVVDDQRANIQALFQVFQADYKVSMATSGEQALALCRSQPPDLVLLDVVMPGMDGFEVCRQLKADDATKDIPVIFVTGHNDEEAETRGLDVGGADFISKPINPRIVRARVKTQLTMKRQSDLLRQWVYIDGLTRVCNRRCFDEHLASEWDRAARLGAPLSVGLVDVDLFKRYNDHYGHPAGDECLRRVAAVMTASLKRPTDMVARYGGEEFGLLLPDTDAAGALHLAGQIREGLRLAQIDHVESSVGPLLTISVGLCTWTPSVAGSAEALLAAADAQLYLAKSRGRDQACGALLAGSS